MARKPRSTPAGYVYHVFNRAVGRTALFRRDEDYAGFERIMIAARERVDLPVLAWCLMKNHWHFVVRPRNDTQVTDFFRWLAHTHAMRWAAAHGGAGHLYQGRFKSFPVQRDGHFLRVCRYVQQNAVRAGVVKRAQNWRWGSLWAQREGPAELRGVLSAWPIERPRNWLDLVNTPLTAQELARVRVSVQRGQPYGDGGWTARTAGKLSLEHTLRSEGRPRKVERAVGA